ncbi:MAG: HAD-IC family P-type ATPase, partial [Oscillospiraceae bacterium]|nr:HAD-IC family P-type ATPase [Oscillospiraceae bacterium]
MSLEKRSWHASKVDEVLQTLQSDREGLSQGEAKRRLEEEGPNKLEEGKKTSVIGIFFSQFKDFMIWVLIAAALISGFLGEWVDASIIFVVILLNAVLGSIQEARAEAALEALKEMAAPYAKVMREGVLLKIPAADLVTGDVVVLEAGDAVPADLRLLTCNSLKAEESALTGESVPVEKTAEAIDDPDASLGDRLDMAYTGTSITYGRATGVVTATGMETEMGKIATSLAAETKETTPLQQKLNKLSNVLSIGVIVIAAVIFVAGLLAGREVLDMFLTAVSLAVA